MFPDTKKNPNWAGGYPAGAQKFGAARSATGSNQSA
jgi:hypothetical protein